MTIRVFHWRLYVPLCCESIRGYETHFLRSHYMDVIMSAMASQVTGAPIVYWTICSGADQRKHQSSASLAFVWGIHRSPMNSPHKCKGPVKRKMFLWRLHALFSLFSTVIQTLVTGYLYSITFIFDRCHRSRAVEKPDEYEYDVKYLTYSFAYKVVVLSEINERSFSLVPP